MKTILESVARGEPGAVERSLNEYGGLVWRLANRYLDRASSEVEDAVQEVFIEIWMKASTYDRSVGGEPAFVATIAHRRLIDYQRRVTARRGATNRARAAAGGVSDTPRLEPIVLDKYSDLTAEFDRLPPEERHALWLSIHSGMSQRQISETLELPVGTVKSRLRRGLSRLYSAVCGASSAGVES